MYGGYYGGWIPATYLTRDIPLDIYANKNNRPYMDIKDWAGLNGQMRLQEMSS